MLQEELFIKFYFGKFSLTKTNDMLSTKLSQVFIFLTMIIAMSCSTKKDSPGDALGEIEFKATGKAEAQQNFKKGMLLLHSFEYEDAAEEFRKAINIDKDFTMAYWGEAMTHNHPLWRYQAYEKATATLKELAPTPEERVAKTKTDFEKDLMRAINILYGKGSKLQRDSSYAAYMGKLYEKNHGNNEIASLYSIALIGSVPVGRNVEVYEQAAEIAKEVLKSNPKHPGALHYLIHAYDDPAHAAMALTTADEYAVVAPSAGHALHMPTHIYLSLGMWNKVISSNIVSWDAGQQRKHRKKLTNDALNYHAYHWLEYGYLQNGRQEMARKILDSMNYFSKELGSGRAREHMIYQKSTFLAETNAYGNEVNSIEVKMDDLNIVTRAMNYFANGMNLFYKKDEKGMNAVITKLIGEIWVDETRISNSSIKFCGSVNAELPNALDIEQATVMLLELNAMNSWLKKDKDQTEKFLKRAVEMESKISYAFGPPTIVKPSFEMYGEWLLENTRPKEAIEQFELSLKAAPNKLLSVKGKEKAEKFLKNNSTASL